VHDVNDHQLPETIDDRNGEKERHQFMCGRYYRRNDKYKIADHFQIHGDLTNLRLPDRNYNITPQTTQAIVRNNWETNDRELVMLRWGMIPFSLRSFDELKGNATTNARSESIFGSWWSDSFRRRRCLIPADGFYEWDALIAPSELSRREQTENIQVVRRLYAFELAGRSPMALAGLWDRWRDPEATNDAPWLETFTIVTTEANEVMAPIHNRMPVIIAPTGYGRWLDCPTTRSQASKIRPPVDLLRPYPAEGMKAMPCTSPESREWKENVGRGIEDQA
jgi:putative SOS response-associated peptidase YedK